MDLLELLNFLPEEGKYHYDGHRACSISLSPEETIKHDYKCPVCGKKVTVGVMHRVERLSDRKEGFSLNGSPEYYSLIPMSEILAEVLRIDPNSKAVNKEYMKLLNSIGNEFKILMEANLDDIEMVRISSYK